MGGQSQVNNWNETKAIADAVAKIPGLMPEERVVFADAMKTAISNTTDAVKKEALVRKLQTLVTDLAAGGFSNGYAGVLTAVVKAIAS